MWCVSCGSQLVAGARFCAGCGTPAGAVPPPAVPRVQLPEVSLRPTEAPAPPGSDLPSAFLTPPPAGAASVRAGATHEGLPPTARPVRGGRLVPALIGAAAALVVLFAIAASLIVTGGATLGSAPDTLEGPGYATPDAAAEAYLAAMKAGDVPAMVKTFAIETYGEHADGALFVERMNGWQPGADPALPPGGANNQINAGTHLSVLLRAIEMQYIALSNPQFDTTVSISGGILPNGRDLNESLAEAFDGTAFTAIESARLIDWQSEFPSLAESYASERNQKNIGLQNRHLRADEIAFRAAQITSSHGDYILFVQLNRYGKSWWVGSFGGNPGQLAGVPTSGLVPAAEVSSS